MTAQVEQDLQHLGGGPVAGGRHVGQRALRPRGPPGVGGWGSEGAAPGLTFSFTRPEPLCRRPRRYSSRHWLLPGDSWEISGRRSG